MVRRIRFGRALRVLFALALAAAVLALLAAGFLATAPGRAAARALIEQWGSRAAGAPLRLGDARIRLLRGRAELTALSLEQPGLRIDVQRIEIGWSPRSGRSVRVIRPHVVLTTTEESAPDIELAGLAAQPWRVLEQVDRAEVVEGSVELRDTHGQPRLIARRLALAMPSGSGAPIALRADEVVVHGAGREPARVAAEATLHLDAGRLLIDRARIANGASIELRGRLDRVQPVTASLNARATGEAALIEAFAPGTGLAGRIEADGTIALDKGAMTTATVTVASPELRSERFGRWAVRGGGRLDGAQFVVEDLTAEGPAGRASLSGGVALRPTAPTDLMLRVEALDPAALMPPGGLKLATRASGRLRWRTTGFDTRQARGDGTLTLTRSRGPGLAPEGALRLRINGHTLAIEDARLAAQGAELRGRITLAGGRADGMFDGELPLASLPGLFADLAIPAKPPAAGGLVRFSGAVSGTLGAPVVEAHLGADSIVVQGQTVSADADARYEAGRLSLAPLILRSGSGEARLTGGVPLSPRGAWELSGEIDGLDLQTALERAGLGGRGTVSGTLDVSGPRDDPRLRASLRGDLRLPPAGTSAAGEKVRLDFDVTAHGRQIELTRLGADLAGGQAVGRGRFDAASNAIEARLDASRLAWARLPGLPPWARRLAGVLSGSLSLGGTTRAPSGELSLKLLDAALDGSALPALALTARADGRTMTISGTAEREFLRGDGTFDPGWPLHARLDLAALPLAAVLQAFPTTRDAQATVDARGTVEIDLALRSPARLQYATSGLVASGKYGGVAWSVPAGTVRGTLESVQLDGLKLEAGASSLRLQGQVGLVPAGPMALDVEGHLDFATLDSMPAARSLDGKGDLRLSVTGTRDAPELTGEARLAGLRGRLSRVRFSDMDVAARFAGRRMDVERLQGNLMGGKVSASGSLPLAGGGEPGRLVFELQDVDLLRTLDRSLRDGFGTSAFLVSAGGEVTASAPSLAGLEVRGQLKRAELVSDAGTLRLAEPSNWVLDEGLLTLPTLRLTGSLGSLVAHAEGEVLGANPTFISTLEGEVDLAVLNAFLPGTTLAGPLQVDTRLVRGPAGWQAEGGMLFVSGRLAMDDLRFAASDVDGELRFDGERITLQMQAASGDGRIEASGALQLGAERLGALEMKIEGQRVPVNYPAGYRGRATGTLDLSGDAGRYRLTGSVSLRQSYYTAELDARVQSLDRLAWQLAVLEGGTLTDKIAIDVRLRLADPVRVRNSRLQLDVDGAVQATGTMAQPLISGHLNLREGGEVTLARARILVSSGSVELNGYPERMPELQMQGTSRVSGTLIEVAAQGPVDDLQLTLSSDRADLAQADLVTLLLTGRTASTAASESGAILAEQLAMSLGGMLQKGVGEVILIDVAPDRDIFSNDTDPTQRFHIGTRISQNMSVLYSAALDGTEKRWVVEFNPNRGRFHLRAISEEDNSLSLEATDRFTFDLWRRRRRTARTRRSTGRETEKLVAFHVEGALPLAEKELRDAARLKAQRRYSPLEREEAADRVRERLVAAGYRAASVDAVTRPATGGVELALRVDAGPVITIRWTGDDPGPRTRSAAEEAWPVFSTPEAAAATIARAALWDLQGQGYYTATVQPEASPTVSGVTITLRVARGPLGKGVDVVFEGNQALSREALLAVLPDPGSQEFFEALDSRSSRIAGEIRIAYAGIGHIRARVRRTRSVFDAATGRLRVTIPVREGPAVTVASIAIPEAAAGARDLDLKLRAGQPFDITAYAADRDTLASWLRSHGWIDAQVRATLETQGPTVAVRYLVDDAVRPRVGEIEIRRSGRTRDGLIRRAITLREGELLQPDQLAQSRERLTELGVFRSVEVRLEPRAGDAQVRDVTVALVERPDVELTYGLRYTTQGEGGAAGGAPSSPEGGQLQAGGGIEFNNPFGFGVKTRVYGVAATERQTWGVNLDAATLAGLRLRTQLFVFSDADDTTLSGFASDVKGTTLQQSVAALRDRRGGRTHDRLRLQWGYTFKDIEYLDTTSGERNLLQGDRGFLSLSAIGDERDSLTDPHRGVFWTATSELARTWLASDVDYVRLYGQFFAYVPLGPLVWAQGFRAGTVPGTDPLLLIENRFRAGGSNTVRGFEQNGLGVQDDEGNSLGGQAVAIFNEELRFPIWKGLQGGVFWDAGNVWLLARQFDLKDLRHSVGGGLRYVFPFGPIRVEYAWILGRKEGEPKGRFVFGLGHAF
jgi:outer membrane protein insertion porin family